MEKMGANDGAHGKKGKTRSSAAFRHFGSQGQRLHRTHRVQDPVHTILGWTRAELRSQASMEERAGGTHLVNLKLLCRLLILFLHGLIVGLG